MKCGVWFLDLRYIKQPVLFRNDFGVPKPLDTHKGLWMKERQLKLKLIHLVPILMITMTFSRHQIILWEVKASDCLEYSIIIWDYYTAEHEGVSLPSQLLQTWKHPYYLYIGLQDRWCSYYWLCMHATVSSIILKAPNKQ